MGRKRIGLVFIVALAVTVGLAGSAGGVRADWFTNKVEEMTADYVSTFNSGDANALAAFYSEDAKLMAPHAATISGRAAIEEFWAGVFGMGTASLTLAAEETFNNGTLGYSLGAYTLAIVPSDGAALDDRGKYVIVWKRGPGGAWEMAVDIFNTDMPPAEPAQ